MIPTLAALFAVALACSLISVIVVLRGWAQMGEGIAHAGFGGAGTAWLLSLLLPSFPAIKSEYGIYACAVLFSLGVAFLVAVLTRKSLLRADTVIGIAVVFSLAWGFLAQGVFMHFKEVQPPDYAGYLIGQFRNSPEFLIGAACLCGLIVLILAAFWREIMFYCFDPVLAETSGVRAGAIHYLLILLVALVIAVGMRMLGSILITALLILPGASALLLSRKMKIVLLLSSSFSLLGALCGVLINARWRFIPAGPAIVLSLVMIFVLLHAKKWLKPQGA